MARDSGYKLWIIPDDYWNRHPEVYYITQIDENDPECTMRYFGKLSEVFDYLGFGLKRERCGYGGLKDGLEYVCMKYWKRRISKCSMLSTEI